MAEHFSSFHHRLCVSASLEGCGPKKWAIFFCTLHPNENGMANEQKKNI